MSLTLGSVRVLASPLCSDVVTLLPLEMRETAVWGPHTLRFGLERPLGGAGGAGQA